MAAESDGLILGLDTSDESVFAAAPRLRVVSCYGVGLDNVDVKTVRRDGVAVTTTVGANTVAPAEMTFGLMLALAGHLPDAVNTVRSGGWGRLRGFELVGKALGAVCLGRIGKAVAQRARAFGMRLIAHDPFAHDVAGMDRVDLNAVWSSADVISLHLEMRPQTRHRVEETALASCKPGVVLVNTACGGLIDEHILAEALADGRVAGVALDGFEREPPDSPLLSAPNVVATLHLGVLTLEAAAMGEMAARNVLTVVRGDELAVTEPPIA